MVAIFAGRHPPQFFHPHDPGGGVKRSNFNIFRTWSCCISNLSKSQMQQHTSKYFANKPFFPPPPPRPCGWCQNSTFSEHAHVEYQIKGNQEYSNMVATIFPTDPPLDPKGQNIKIQLFQNMVMFYLKLKGITKAATW